MADEKNTTDSKTPPIITGLNLAAYGTAAAVGGYVARDDIKNAVYEENKGYTVYETPEGKKVIRRPTEEDIKFLNGQKPIMKLREQRDFDKDMISAENKGKPPHVIAKLRAARVKQYMGDVAVKIEEDLGLKGTRDYWIDITRPNKTKIIERAGAFSGIVLTVLLTAINSKPLTRLLSSHDKKQNTVNER